MLLQQLRSVVKDEREIEFVIADAAGGGMRSRRGRSVEYLTATSPPELYAKLWFRRGRITKLEAGPAMRGKDGRTALLDRAKEETRHTHGSFVATRVQFAALELKGTWMWRNQVRISPSLPSSMPEEADRMRAWGASLQGSNPAGPPFAFLLEVAVEKSPNVRLEGVRTLWNLDAYQSLLTLFLSPYVLYVDYPSDTLWTLEQREDRVVNVLAQPGFAAGEVGRSDGFPERAVQAAPIYEGPDYYNHLWFSDSEVLIPPSMADDFDRVEALQPDAKKNFLRACYWYALAIQHRNSHAVSHVAFAAAIECLLSDAPASVCACCGKSSGAGPTKQFANHVKRYSAIPEVIAKQRDELYGVRSDLVHGTFASRIDIGHFSSSTSLLDDSMLMQIVAKRCLINWLRDSERTPSR